MADIQIEFICAGNFCFTAQRGGVFWTSPLVGYVIYGTGASDLGYRKTSDGGATWASQVIIRTGTMLSWDCWADWQTAGDAGTKIHITYIDVESDDVRYVYLDTDGDSVGGDDLIEACQGTGAMNTSVGRQYHHITITKTRGGNLAVALRYMDSVNAEFFSFYTSPDGDTWTSEASPWEAAPDYILLFPGNEADNQDIWATFWDVDADEISLKTYDDSENSWSEQLISASMAYYIYHLQMDGAIRLSDGHLILAAWSQFDNAAADLMVWDINGAGSITAKTNIITNTSEYFLASVFINQSNDDIYVAYVGGTAVWSAVAALYKKSVDGGANWGGQQALQADAEDDEKWISAGAAKAAWGGKFQPYWQNDDLRDLFTNVDNGISITPPVEQAVGGGAVGMAGSLGIKVFRGVGDGSVGMAGALGAIKRFPQDVGGGSIGMAGILGRKIYIGVGDGAVGMAGTLGRFIKIAVGAGSVGMAGSLGRKVFIAVGGGDVGMAGTLGTIKRFLLNVGEGAVGMAGTLSTIKRILLNVGDGAVGMRGFLTSLFVLHYAVVKINEVQIRYVKGSLKINKRIEERSTADFTVWDKAAASHYVKGQPIQIYDNGNHLTFAGFIHSSEEKRVGVSSLFHFVRCADNHYLADKRIAGESYVEDTAAGDIVLDLWAKYLDGEGVTIGEIQDGPTIGQVKINYVRVSEALDALAELANFIWYIDETKKLYFISRVTNAAPWTAISSLIDHARITHTNPLYRNRQFSRGGKSETAVQVENRTGDGEQDSFAMGYPLAKVPTITVAGRGAQTVGIKGLEEGEKDWYWSEGDPVVTAAIAPEADAAIQITYIGEWVVFTLTEDEDAIADRKSVEGGGTGYVDDIFRDASLTTVAASLEKAAAKLARYGVTGRKLTYDTVQRGLEPGQLQTVNYPLLNLNNAEMLIESVRIRVSGKTMTYYVTALEGPEIGSWSKIFQQLIERDKTIDRLLVGGEAPLIIPVPESEEWGWHEEVAVTVTTRCQYYITGDDSYVGIYGDAWGAQTFTPEISHKITSVRLKLFRDGLPGTVTVSIKATDGSGHPTGADLCSGTTDGDALTEDTDGAWYEITLGAGYNLDADTKYAIVVRALDAELAEPIFWRFHYAEGAYARGNYEKSENAGGEWSSQLTWDFMFEEWGEIL